ncbi:MAG: indole-3-glycerol phosphate synthase TrpC [Crocinitomicaceae bacterium]|nr:indole-3-glycerol phosphate synthase TrpC [Crocinitomicaceae bacterium]
MKTILDTIVANKRIEVANLKSNKTYTDFENSELFNRDTISLKQSIQTQNFGIIAEIKRKSPSTGVIDTELSVSKQGGFYEENGVAGISCLTDNLFFGGNIQDLNDLRDCVDTPILRKEFIIDEIQLFEAKSAGADAVLLISEILDSQKALHLTIMAQQLGMEVMMECHDKHHLDLINDQVDIIGINNRNLHLQKTDIRTSFDLYPFLPKDKVLISESGIKMESEVFKLMKTGYHGALIGESILNNTLSKNLFQTMKTESAL